MLTRSPRPLANTTVRPVGAPVWANRSRNASSRALGSTTPPPEPSMASVAPSGTSRAASSAVICLGCEPP